MIKFIITTFIIFFSFWNITLAEEWEWSSTKCEWKDSLCSPEYMIDTTALWLWTSMKGATAKETANNVLQTIITKLMVAFWVLSLLIMTVGWWYMIFAHGQDELLNKWKWIFNSWLIALIVALSSWIIIKIVISLIY